MEISAYFPQVIRTPDSPQSGVDAARGTIAITGGPGSPGRAFVKNGSDPTDWVPFTRILDFLQTVDNVPSFFDYLTGNSDATLVFEFTILAKQVAGTAGALGDAVSQTSIVTMKKVGGVLTLLDVTTPSSYKVDPGITIGFSIVANNLRVTLTGVVNRTFDWSLFLLDSFA